MSRERPSGGGQEEVGAKPHEETLPRKTASEPHPPLCVFPAHPLFHFSDSEPSGPKETPCCRGAKIAAKQFLPLNCLAVTLSAGVILKEEKCPFLWERDSFGGVLGDNWGEGNCESKIVARQWGVNFYRETSRCLAGPSGRERRLSSKGRFGLPKRPQNSAECDTTLEKSLLKNLHTESQTFCRTFQALQINSSSLIKSSPQILARFCFSVRSPPAPPSLFVPVPLEVLGSLMGNQLGPAISLASLTCQHRFWSQKFSSKRVQRAPPSTKNQGGHVKKWSLVASSQVLRLHKPR